MRDKKSLRVEKASYTLLTKLSDKWDNGSNQFRSMLVAHFHPVRICSPALKLSVW